MVDLSPEGGVVDSLVYRFRVLAITPYAHAPVDLTQTVASDDSGIMIVRLKKGIWVGYARIKSFPVHGK